MPRLIVSEFLTLDGVMHPLRWRKRRADYDFLMSAQARDVIAQEGINVIDYRPIQRAWNEAGHPDPRPSGAS